MPSEIQFGLYVGGEFEKYVMGYQAPEVQAEIIAEDYEHDIPQIDLRDMDTGEIITVFYKGAL